MKWLRGVIAAAVLAMVAVPAVGQNNVQFVEAQWGSYWGPYTLMTLPGQVEFDAYCVDYTHHVWGGVQWQAVYTPFTDVVGLLANTRYGTGSAWLTGGRTGFDLQQNYVRSAWLAMQFSFVANRSTDGRYIHNAIWHLWGSAPTGTDEPYLTNARNQTLDVNDFSDWYVVSDKNGARQEFITQHVNVVPEPATLILMGTGLVAVMGMTVVMRQSIG